MGVHGVRPILLLRIDLLPIHEILSMGAGHDVCRQDSASVGTLWPTVVGSTWVLMEAHGHCCRVAACHGSETMWMVVHLEYLLLLRRQSLVSCVARVGLVLLPVHDCETH